MLSLSERGSNQGETSKQEPNELLDRTISDLAATLRGAGRPIMRRLRMKFSPQLLARRTQLQDRPASFRVITWMLVPLFLVRSHMDTKSGFAFVISHIDVEGGLPMELIPNHQFRRASDSEIETIREILRASIPIHTTGDWPRYDCVVREERYEGRSSYHFDELPRDKWKYWVVAFDGFNVEMHQLELPCLLLEPEIEFGFQVYFNELGQKGERTGWSMIPLHLVERYAKPKIGWRNARTITALELGKVGELHRLCTSLPETFSFLDHALKNFNSIRRIPRQSELIAVGYFSIIEALVTHSPRLTETLDSISHQLRTKLSLLRKRFSTPVEYSQYFSPAAEETVWAKLYSYRSALAHGTIPRFDSELQILRDHESVVRFLQKTVKELLLVGLHDPEFLADLKQC